MDFSPASPKERMIYYSEEWNPKDVPEFIIRSIKEKEFAFDHEGNGYTDRYNAFGNIHGLETKVKTLNPYAVCASTAYYEHPEQRAGWRGAELVFDIDAKDQPVRSCSCAIGSICEKCLEEAKGLALIIIDTLREDFGVKEVYLAYSGRGYHIHVLDKNAEPLENRQYMLDYVMGSIMPMDFQMVIGYAKTWRKMFALTLSKMKQEDFLFLNKNVANSAIANKELIIKNLNARMKNFISTPGIGKTSQDKILNEVMRLSGLTVDGKVTIDTKRILRLPTTLHSKISMICTLAKHPESFDPFNEAVPRFVLERAESNAPK